MLNRRSKYPRGVSLDTGTVSENRVVGGFLEVDSRDVGIRSGTSFLFWCGWMAVPVSGLAGTKNSGIT